MQERTERLGTRGTVRSDQEFQDVIDRIQEHEVGLYSLLFTKNMFKYRNIFRGVSYQGRYIFFFKLNMFLCEQFDSSLNDIKALLTSYCREKYVTFLIGLKQWRIRKALFQYRMVLPSCNLTKIKLVQDQQMKCPTDGSTTSA